MIGSTKLNRLTRLTRPVCSLVFGLGGLICFIVLLNLLGDKVALVDSNRSKGIEANAYFYSEVGDLNEFLDDENGRYSTKSLDR